MVSLSCIVLFGLLGLVVDVGWGYYLKQVAQAAVDSAVLAGVTEAQNGGAVCGAGGVLCQTDTACPSTNVTPPETDFDVACLYASTNGFPTTDSQSVKISAGSGNPPGLGISATYWMTATATQTMQLSFLRVLGFSEGTVAARATAAVTGGNGGGSCMYVLDPNSSASYNQPGNTTVKSACGIFVNSSASDAFTVKGTGAVSSPVIDVAGGASLSNNSTVTPAPTTGISPAVDPFASLPSPSYHGCDQSALHLTSGSYYLSPGVYCGGIQIGSATVNFAAGMYVLNGGGLQVSSTNAAVNGSGVTFYNTSNGYSFGPLAIAGNASVNLSAPTSGTYKGILFYQDRNILSSASSAIGGGSTEQFAGTLYMPTAQLSFAGGTASNMVTMALVVKQLNIVGNSYISADPTGNITGLNRTTVSLVQ